MIESDRCRVCDEDVPSRTIPIVLPGQRTADFQLCEACWSHLEHGLRQTDPDAALETSVVGPGFRLSEPQLRGLVAVGLQATIDLPVARKAQEAWERRRMVRVELRRMSVDLDHARAASGRGDLVAALEAVRLLQGRAVVTRQVLESMLGSQPSVAELPPLVRAVQAVGRVISDQEIDRLESDELRARLRAVLYALDHELQLFLQPAGAELVPVDPDRDVPPGEVTAPERP